MTDQKGFTSKEFIMVIVVMGLLCVLAIPPFYALQNARRRTDMESILATIETKLEKLKEEGLPIPTRLDDNPLQSPCLTCFEGILPEGQSAPLWYKFAENVYLYSVNGDHETVTDYQQSGNFKVEYDTVNGKLSVEEIR